MKICKRFLFSGIIFWRVIVKRLIFIFCALMFIISLCACSSRLSMLDAETSFEERETAKMAKAIVAALENKDVKALKNLFSINAKEKAKDLDAGIEYLMQFYQGKSTSLIDELGSTSDHIDHGQSKKY